MFSKQTNLKGVNSWNKIWSLKSLAMFKCGSRTSLITNDGKAAVGYAYSLMKYFSI